MQPYERVRQIRRAKGITQTHVAKSIPVPVANYNKVEMGRRPLRVEWIEPIAKALGVKPSDFFCSPLDETSKVTGEEKGAHQA